MRIGMLSRILSLGLGSAFLLVAAGAAQNQNMYTGTVTASQIVSTGGSSSIGLWEKKLNCHDEADCARRLVGAGGKYVLVTNKGVYTLSDQAKAAQFVAQRVTVTGSFDTSRKTIEVAEVQPYNASTVSAGAQ
jgi:hypothetical protein